MVQAYCAAIAHGAADLDWERGFAPDVLQEEFPNRLLPGGLASGSTVVVEAEGRGRVSRDAGPFAAGTELRTRFAQVLELREGKIVALRTYDCFYPW